MFRLAGCVLLLCLNAFGEARAGAWPREEGEVFLAFSQTMSTGARTMLEAVQDVRSYTSIYAEYGLTPEVTLGFDAGLARGDQDEGSGWNAFLRRPVWMSQGGHRVAAELGIGQLNEPEFGRQWRIKPGVSWGKGFESRWGGGWAGLETSASYRFAAQDFGLKADLTLGLKPRERWMVIFQVQSGKWGDDEPIVRLAPSVVRRFGERTHLQLGFVQSVAGDDAMGVKFGTWFTF
ncbi:MAG: hypothetical protein AAGG56_14150 [Pseudomonadota bacterium]